MKIILPYGSKAQYLAANPRMAQALNDYERHEGNAIACDTAAPSTEVCLDEDDNDELTGINNDHNNIDNNQREENNNAENDNGTNRQENITTESNRNNSNENSDNDATDMCHMLLTLPPQDNKTTAY